MMSASHVLAHGRIRLPRARLTLEGWHPRYESVLEYLCQLIILFTALVSGADLAGALDLVCVLDGDEAVGATEARAQSLATLLLRAEIVGAADFLSTRNWGEAVGAREGGAERLAALINRAGVLVA